MALCRNDESLWEIEITQDDFSGYIEPYIGNGIIGCRFDRLIIATDKEKHLRTISRAIYDGGKQIPVPVWNYIDLVIDGVRYDHAIGEHQCRQILNLRNAVVSLTDRWEYKKNCFVDIDIKMLVPRTHGFGSILKITISGIEDKAVIGCGINGKHTSDIYNMKFSSLNGSTILGSYQTKKQNRAVSQVIKWKSSGLEVIKTDITDREINTVFNSIDKKLELEIFHALGSYAETYDTSEEALKTADSMFSMGFCEILERNEDIWKEIWSRALYFDHTDKETEKMILTHQFYLLCSLSECSYPLGALGLSYPGWYGSQLWDADFWIFRAVLLLWPEFARSITDFRRKTLHEAKRHAEFNGYDGLWYGWQTDDEGKNISEPAYEEELHLNIWIAIAAWEYYVATGDKEYLVESSWPIIKGIADFFASRTNTGEDGYFHIKNVVGPDEAVCEHGKGTCDDNFLTNYGVKRIMEIAIESALLTGEKPREKWEETRDRIFLLAPDEEGIIPEFKGYAGEGIKQADLILAFYPLGFETEKDFIMKNVFYYMNKIMAYGPLMTTQIESCIIMRLGDKEGGIKNLLSGMAEYTRGKHYIPFECRNNDISIMLTGIAGELQALIFGYYGYDINDSDKIPRLNMDETTDCLKAHRSGQA